MTEGEPLNLPCTLEVYRAEGDALAHRGEYAKAIQCYSKALLLDPTDRECLVSRCRCHLKLANPKSAMEDAESSLKDDENFWKGILQKAECLYVLGNFEAAAHCYHTGARQRPDKREFVIGVHKCEEAIQNRIGDVWLHSRPPLALYSTHREIGLIYYNVQTYTNHRAVEKARIKLDKSGDISFFSKIDGQAKKYPRPVAPAKKDGKLPYSVSEKASGIDKKTLGQLKEDIDFIEKVLTRRGYFSEKNNQARKLAEDCHSFLVSRAVFWKQIEVVRSNQPRPAKPSTVSSKHSKSPQPEALSPRAPSKPVPVDFIDTAPSIASSDDLEGSGSEELPPSELGDRMQRDASDGVGDLETDLEELYADYQQGSWENALAHVEKIVERLPLEDEERRPFDDVITKIFVIKGSCNMNLKHYAEATEAFDLVLHIPFEGALESPWTSLEPWLELRALRDFAFCQLQRGKLEAALRLSELAIARAQALVDQAAEASLGLLQGEILSLMGRPEEAKGAFEHAKIAAASCAGEQSLIELVEEKMKDLDISDEHTQN